MSQPAQGGKSYIVERRDEQAGLKREQVIGFLVESQGYGVKFPANQQIVEVSGKIIRAEPAIDLDGES